MDLAAFLLARIAEDEAIALRARDNAGSFGVPDHVVRFSPARVLAECEAKRGVLGLLDIAESEFRKAHLGAADYGVVAQAAITRDALLRAVQLLALPYAGHPDYRDEWRP